MLQDVMECVRRTRRTPGFWRMMRDDLEESERRGQAGCARYEVHHGPDGLVGKVTPKGVERVPIMATVRKGAA